MDSLAVRLSSYNFGIPSDKDLIDRITAVANELDTEASDFVLYEDEELSTLSATDFPWKNKIKCSRMYLLNSIILC